MPIFLMVWNIHRRQKIYIRHLTGMLYIDAHGNSVGIKIQYKSIRNFKEINRRYIPQMDI